MHLCAGGGTVTKRYFLQFLLSLDVSAFVNILYISKGLQGGVTWLSIYSLTLVVMARICFIKACFALKLRAFGFKKSNIKLCAKP